MKMKKLSLLVMISISAIGVVFLSTAAIFTSPEPVGVSAPKLTPTLIKTTTSSVTWATWTGTVTSVATSLATYTAGVRSLPSPLLDRLVKNKPSIWGNKGFYVLLGALYLTLLGLFLRQILDTVKRRP